MVIELRHYVAGEGKEAQMLKVMKENVVPIFKRMGFKISEFWVQDGAPRHVWYTMPWPSAEAIPEAWAKFRQDAEWLKVKEANAGLFEKVESFVLRDVPGGRL
jgi:hypothetical protein